LPVLVSRWHGAAAGIVRSQDLGLVYDESTDDEMAAWLGRWQGGRAGFRQRALTYARAEFSIDVVADLYRGIYRKLISGRE